MVMHSSIVIRPDALQQKLEHLPFLCHYSLLHIRIMKMNFLKQFYENYTHTQLKRYVKLMISLYLWEGIYIGKHVGSKPNSQMSAEAACGTCVTLVHWF